jgi:hypothetical protein
MDLLPFVHGSAGRRRLIENSPPAKRAHIPPPHHGQSVMVQVMPEGLRADERRIDRQINGPS